MENELDIMLNNNFLLSKEFYMRSNNIKDHSLTLLSPTPCDKNFKKKEKKVSQSNVVVPGSKSSRTMTSLSGGECHNPTMVVPPIMSLRTMISLSGGECHNLTMKRVGCDPHVTTREAATLKWRPSGHARA